MNDVEGRFRVPVSSLSPDEGLFTDIGKNELGENELRRVKTTIR